jgi:hypothetical protein
MNEKYDYRERKIVAVLDKSLAPGVALNVVGHMAIRLGASHGEAMMGQEHLHDASGVVHPGIAKYPFIITAVKKATVRRAIQQARENNEISLVDYPCQMLTTGHDDELSAALKTVREDQIEYLGCLLYGGASAVNAITGKYSLWKP